MRKYFFLIILITINIFISGCCLNKNSKTENIGVILPLSGERSSFGQSSKSGIDLAIEKINAIDSNSIKFKVLFEDSKGESKTAVSSYYKLINEGIKILIGPISSSEVLSIAPIAEKDKIILLSPGASSPKITDAGDYIFRNVPSDLYEASLMADFVVDSLKLNRVAVLYSNTEYGNGVFNSFSENYRKKGGMVFSESYEDGANDFKTQLIKIKSNKPQAIYFVGYTELGNMIKQAYELKIECQYLTTAIFEDESILQNSANASENIIFTSITFDEMNPSIRAIEFVDSYKKKFNKIPDGYAAVAYDAIYIIKEALSISSDRKIGIKDALYQIKSFPGLLGDMGFDNNGDVILPIKLKTVKNGNFINYK